MGGQQNEIKVMKQTGRYTNRGLDRCICKREGPMYSCSWSSLKQNPCCWRCQWVVTVA